MDKLLVVGDRVLIKPLAEEKKTKYIPLQTKVGDLAIFLQKGAIGIVYEEEKYFIVSQHSILLLERDLE